MSVESMKDLEIAKNRLLEKSRALVVVSNGKILFETNASGIRGFLSAIERIGSGMAGSSLADKIVGEAAAQLCVFSRVREVYAVILSQFGKNLLAENDIQCEFESLVPHILNKEKTDLCPFEKIVAGSITPEEAFRRLRDKTTASSA
jgi:hypothetical protein